MIEKNKNYSPSKQEALVNELKGTLFEYLVAHNIAKESDFEIQFLESLDRLFIDLIKEYEIYLRMTDMELLKNLPILAREVSLRIIEGLSLKKISGLNLLGKSKEEKFKETDIEILVDNNKIPISLKLCKSNSYVNTKSGGVRSFFSKYFNKICEIEKVQDVVNEKISTIFNGMAYDLHQLYDLEYIEGFGDSWRERELPNLPGDLDEFAKKRLHQSYHEIIKVFYGFVIDLNKFNELEFKEALLPLMGIGKDDIVQVSCFHEKKDNKKYCLNSVSIFNCNDFLKDLSEFEILPLKEGVSSFEIKMLNKRLQIRIKPMNKFTVPSYKVNCSVKEVKSEKSKV